MLRPPTLAALCYASRMAAGPASSSAATQAADGRPRAAVTRGRIPQRAPNPATTAPDRRGRPGPSKRLQRDVARSRLRRHVVDAEDGHRPPGHGNATLWPPRSPLSFQAHEPPRSDRSERARPQARLQDHPRARSLHPGQLPSGTTRASAARVPERSPSDRHSAQRARLVCFTAGSAIEGARGSNPVAPAPPSNPEATDASRKPFLAIPCRPIRMRGPS